MKVQLRSRTTNEYIGMTPDTKSVTLYFSEYTGEDSSMGATGGMGPGMTLVVTAEEAKPYELGGVYSVGLTAAP